ncbi:hypothetical protein EC333_20200 [Shigella flexneri]|nr:hypothetical protein [Shigella flexneri]PQN09819.1 hypothetical protein C5K22_23875 [Shigella dysenteriae]
MWCCRGTVCTIPYVDQYNRNDNFRFRAQPKYILGHLSNRLPDTAPFFNKKNQSFLNLCFSLHCQA